MDTLLGALRSKTVWFNVIGILSVLFASEQIQAIIAPEYLLIIQAGINIVLRRLTTQSLASKA